MSLGRVQLGGPEGLMLREQLEEEVEGTQQFLTWICRRVS